MFKMNVGGGIVIEYNSKYSRYSVASGIEIVSYRPPSTYDIWYRYSYVLGCWYDTISIPDGSIELLL